MAIITNFSIDKNSIKRNSIYVNFACSLEYDTYNGYGTAYILQTFTLELLVQWIFTVNGNQTTTTNISGGITCTYDNSNNANNLSVNCSLNYKVRTGYVYWDLYTTNYELSNEPLQEGIFYNDGYMRKDRVYRTYDDSRQIYIYDIDIYYTAVEWTEYSNKTISSQNSLTFYPPPKEFYFNNCTSGNLWLIDKGINSLITNITDFADYATQWKRWKNLSSNVNNCPGFFSNGKLTASQLNSVHNYVGTGKNYKVGDKISADMFNSLANIINT